MESGTGICGGSNSKGWLQLTNVRAGGRNWDDSTLDVKMYVCMSRINLCLLYNHIRARVLSWPNAARTLYSPRRAVFSMSAALFLSPLLHNTTTNV